MREGGRGAKKVSTQWKKVSGVFPHNGNMFPKFFHTMEACFGHFSTQWKHVLRRFSMVWKNRGRIGLEEVGGACGGRESLGWTGSGRGSLGWKGAARRPPRQTATSPRRRRFAGRSPCRQPPPERFGRGEGGRRRGCPGAADRVFGGVEAELGVVDVGWARGKRNGSRTVEDWGGDSIPSGGQSAWYPALKTNRPWFCTCSRRFPLSLMSPKVVPSSISTQPTMALLGMNETLTSPIVSSTPPVFSR